MTVARHLTMELLSYRSQRLIMRIERETGRLAASKAFVKANGLAVLAGCFSGMRYCSFISEVRNLVPKLLGSYEDELTPWIEEVVSAQYPMIVNIGSADGYYTVGLALRSPCSDVVAFDTDRWARKATQSLASENRVSNVSVRPWCTAAWLNANLRPGSLLLIDCEGAEAELLDVRVAPALKDCDIIVELHDQVRPGIAGQLTRWFGESHAIRTINAREKHAADYPGLEAVPEEMQDSVVSEGRHGPQQWFFMTRKR